MKRLISLFAVTALILMVGEHNTLVNADVDGDGLDEIGSFAVEVSGNSGGPWIQIYEPNGAILGDFHVMNGFSQFKIKTLDVDGDTRDDVVVLAVRITDGAAAIQVFNELGVMKGSGWVTGGAGFSDFQLFPANWDGGAATEIGVGFRRDGDGVGFLKILRCCGGGTLTTLRGTAVVGPGFHGFDWQGGDFNGDGTQEVFVGFNSDATGEGVFKIWEPQTNRPMGGAFVAGPAFSGHQWVLGNFAPSLPGDEVLIGFIRSADGAAAYQVRNRLGAVVAGRFIAAGTLTQFSFRAVSTGTFDLVMLGFQRASDGVPGYTVWNTNSATRVGGRWVLGPGFRIVDWLAGDFDGTPATGHAVAFLFVRQADGAIGYQSWDRGGTTRIGGAFVLSGDFVNAQFLTLRPVSQTRDDLLIGAQKVGGAPVVKVITATGATILSKFIFNNDVV